MAEKKDSRKNNFNIIRTAACLFVFTGHMGRILGIEPPAFSGYVLHEMGVTILFMLAGYLVTESWLKDPDPLRYGIRRFFRLWPPFAVMVLIMTFIAGPLVSGLDFSAYFQSWYTAYLNNLRLYITYSLPGVFTDLPVPNTVNGSIWTMPVEAAMYVITPLIAAVLHMRRRSERSFMAAVVLTAMFLTLDLYFIVFMRGTQVVIYRTDLISAHHLGLSYITGALFTYPQMKKSLNIQKACVGMGVLLILTRAPAPLVYFFIRFFLPAIDNAVHKKKRYESGIYVRSDYFFFAYPAGCISLILLGGEACTANYPQAYYQAFLKDFERITRIQFHCMPCRGE